MSSLRVCVSGGAALPLEVLHGFEAAFGCVILEGYGLSETSPVASFNRADGVRKPGSIGTPVDGVEMRLLDPSPEGVGEIAIRGHNVMKGYWRNPDATRQAIDADGWFRSGDLARVDEDGCYFIVDRKKELIIRGGYNVYPREIEEVLYEHPAVREAAVVGIPHPELGEEVGAAVALKAGRRGRRGRRARVRQGPGRRLQVPAPRLVRRRAAEGRRRARSSSARSRSRSRRPRGEHRGSRARSARHPAHRRRRRRPRRFVPAGRRGADGRRARAPPAPAGRRARRRSAPSSRASRPDARGCARPRATGASPTARGRPTRCCARLLQAYLAAGGAVDGLIADAELDWRDERQARFAAGNVLDALAPTNFPLTNPAVLREIVDHGGTNLARGARQLVRDVSRSPRLPASVDTRRFSVGENLATSAARSCSAPTSSS